MRCRGAMPERATQKGTSDIVLSCPQSLYSQGDPASSRQRIAQLTLGTMQLRITSSARESEVEAPRRSNEVLWDPMARKFMGGNMRHFLQSAETPFTSKA